MMSKIPRPGPRTLTGLCCLIIFLAVCAFHSRVFFQADVTFPWDFAGYHYPLLVAYADAIHAGELPRWDPLTYCGRPLLANPQVAGLYPPIAFVAAWCREGLLARLEWLTAAHIALARVLTFFLARPPRHRNPLGPGSRPRVPARPLLYLAGATSGHGHG